jgi:hypothetical protein
MNHLPITQEEEQQKLSEKKMVQRSRPTLKKRLYHNLQKRLEVINKRDELLVQLMLKDEYDPAGWKEHDELEKLIVYLDGVLDALRFAIGREDINLL